MPAATVTGLSHVGIRVHDLARSVAFYELLGFVKTVGPIGEEPVAILAHPCGVEINLILNAPSVQAPNVLMDVPDRHAGITHIALSCPDVDGAKAVLAAAGATISGGPVDFPGGSRGLFLRDPDRNVIELNQPPS